MPKLERTSVLGIVIIAVAVVIFVVGIFSQKQVQQALGFVIPVEAENAIYQITNAEFTRSGASFSIKNSQKGTPRAYGFTAAPDEIWCVIVKKYDSVLTDEYWEVYRVGLVWTADRNADQRFFREIGCSIG